MHYNMVQRMLFPHEYKYVSVERLFVEATLMWWRSEQ